jgi:hypothetical protein
MSTIKGSLIPITPEDGQENFNILFAGNSGDGKTHNMATWPNPLYLYPDRNVATLAKFKLPYVPIRDWKEFETTVLPLLRARQWVDGEGNRIDFPFRTLVMDTISSLADYCYDYLAPIYKDDKNSYKLWDKFLGSMMNAAKILVDLSTPIVGKPSCHVLIGCHLRDKENSSGNTIGTKLDISGRTAFNLPRLFDSVFLCRRETKRDDEGKVRGKEG